MYVAVTRAQRSLTLTWCAARKRGRELLRQAPSRFIEEMKLQARPAARSTVPPEQAREQLGRLRELLAARTPR